MVHEIFLSYKVYSWKKTFQKTQIRRSSSWKTVILDVMRHYRIQLIVSQMERK